MYRCNCCNEFFGTFNVYEEEHGLKNPPFERVAVCPMCGGDDFYEYNANVEKFDVAEKVLPAIAAFNRYWAGVCENYGNGCFNADFDEGINSMIELISELFSYVSVDKERQMFNLSTDKDVKKFLLYLKG